MMRIMYQLIFSNQTNLLPHSNDGNVQSVQYMQSSPRDAIACVRSGRDLIGYKYKTSTDTWKQYWRETTFSNEANYPLDRYPWLLTNTLLPDADVIVLKHPDGIRFYKIDAVKPGLKLLKEDGNFHDVFDYTLLLGSFYPDKGYIGALTRDLKGQMQFYAASQDSFLPDTNDPLFPLQKELSLTPIWRSIQSDLFVAKILHNHQEAIGLRSPDGLEIYQFNAEYSLEKIVQTKQIVQPLKKDLDRLYFADLTHQKYRDVLHLNNSGLFVYQYRDGDYKCLNQNTEFTLSNGWLPHYTDSIMLIDINDDKRDDIIFTGPQGIAALTFDSTTRNWKTLLNSEQLSGLEQFATVVGSISASPPVKLEPSIFTQDAAGKLLWAKIVHKPDINNIKKPTTSTTPTPSLFVNRTEPEQDIVLPEQIARTSLSEKPILRWLEQWSDKFLKEAVDVASGQVHLKIPLIDTSTSNWGLKISLFYDSRSTTTDVLGTGWSVPLTEDYIFVDYQGSTNPENTRYILVAKGIPHVLKAIKNEKGIQWFRLDGDDKKEEITIKYDPAKEWWTIEGDEEINFYGKTIFDKAQDALRFSLSWPNWVGPGRNKAQLQSSIMAWYLNKRFDKYNQNALHYYYEIDSSKFSGDKLYTSALRLKTITDNKEMRLSFNYSHKTSSEYTTPNPIDNEGNIVFPVPLVQTQYLQGYNISTSTYSQELKFVYELENGTRFLTAISQQLLSYNDPLLQFSYQNLLDKHVLKTCRLVPRGSMVNFSYESLTPAVPTSFSNKMISYPITDKCKVFHGPDYAVLAYKDDNAVAYKVTLRILNREMKEVDSVVADTNLIGPSNSEIKDYSVRAIQNSFVVSIVTDSERAVYIFNRDSKQTWSTKPMVRNFNKNALIRFGDTLIAVADRDKNSIILFEQADNKFSWNEKILSLSRSITFLAVYKQLVVGYDDNQLWLFHKTQSNWQSRVLESGLPMLASMNRRTLASFDLASTVTEQVSSALEQNGLQIFNNFISLSSLQERDGQLFLHIHLFLLDSENKVANKKSFKIVRQNLYKITFTSKSDDGSIIYEMVYVKGGGKYAVRVKSVSGKRFDDIRNKNLRADAREDQKTHTNNDPKFKKASKTIFLVDWNLYTVQISQYGVFCGNDTILRMTGTDWAQESFSYESQPIRLGQHFILKAGDNKLSYKLYKQDNDRNPVGNSIKELQLHSPGQLVIRYPAYIAYQTQPNLVNMLTFQDDKTLGQTHTFKGEELLLESDLQNLITVSNTTISSGSYYSGEYECKVRPISALIPVKSQLFVNQVMLTDGNVKRLIGYRHSFTNNIQNGTYIESVSMIPGDDKNEYGWHEAVRYHHLSSGNITKAEHWFNANGEEVLMPPKENTEEEISNKTSEFNKGLVFDRSGKWLISDFSPYNITDEMTAYYGFESYEKNLISDGGEKNVTKIWHFNDADVIRGNFAFTGESFLQLTNSSFLEGVLKPRDQETTYLIACWIRCSVPLTLDTPVPYLKAVINTIDGVEIIGLLGQTKHRIDDWFYLELQVDFQMLNRIYNDYVDYSIANNNMHTITLSSINNVQYTINIRVEAPVGQTVDLDHIRFSPLTLDFQAKIYYKTGICTAVIQANGLIIRNIYNRLQQEISNTDEEGRLVRFLSSSKTGKLPSIAQGKISNVHSNILSFLPESGFHETFDLYALCNRWQVDSPHAWQIAPGQLWHKRLERHGITTRTHLFDSRSAAIRLYFALEKSRSSLSFHWNKSITFEFIRQPDGFTKLILSKNSIISMDLPSAGELIIMLEQNYAWLWFDGVLLIDQELPMSEIAAKEFTPWSSFKMYVQGEVLLEDLLVMNRPQVKVEYYNAFGEKIQVIQLEDTKTALVTETLYDAIGRDAIVTKTTRIGRKAGHPILSYHADFVRNKNYFDLKSVWYTGKLHGEVDRLNPTDLGVAYIRNKYAPNPLNQVAVLGLPGPEFSVTGRYATKMSQHSDIAFLDNLFPTSHGYRQSVEHTPYGTLKITIFNKSDNQVATYVRVPSYNHLLSTYEYDTKNRLIKILPPLYHEKVNTAIRRNIWQPGEDSLSIEEKQWQRVLATSFVYDKYDRLIRKTTPDSGVTEYIYNTQDQLRFVVALNSTQQTKTIIYNNYDVNGQLSTTGYFVNPLSTENLKKLVENYNLPNTRKFQDFRYADDHINPLLRNRIKFCITYNKGEPIIDKLQFNADQEILSKTAITVSGKADADKVNEYKKQYVNNKVHTLTYPVNVNGNPLTIVHKYNKLGQLIALNAKDEQNQYATFSYHASGELASENYQQDKYGFTRKYHYNSPGFLTQLTDPFLTEELTYTEKGYGQTEYNGMVTQVVFNASWPINSDGRWFQLQEHDLETNYSKLCLRALKRMGYLTALNKPIKLYIRNVEPLLPLVCGGKTSRNIAKLLAEKQTPKYYGHRYAYGNHQELVKAKYFTEDTELLVEPLQPGSFAKEISNITLHHSQMIWHLLVKGDYIITDQQRTDSNTAIGKRGISLFRSKDLNNDLIALNNDFNVYVEPIEKLIMSLISKQQKISLTDFETVFFQWEGLDTTSSILAKNQRKAIAGQIGQMLFNKGYLPTESIDYSGALDTNFISILRNYTRFIPQIVRVLSKYFAYSIGETPFDVESYKIDANGNHHLFYTGFNRYELIYFNSTNKIENVKLLSPTANETNQMFSMLHDEKGNVIKALHKGIQSIEYHPVSQRTTSIKLIDGRILRFYYDAQGERVLKRVYNAEGKISQETHYLRDEQGRVLVDRQTKYLSDVTQEIVTAYLYGPRGLLGFFRNNNFYSVTTDHAGSVRLIIEKGKVVAAYDYLPYGQLMRSYGNDPRVQIMYRYTGQEWDEETGLYNYHARFYDPVIGRFYQPDPKSQYFSPYKYAGNSPISTIDPDGEFAFILIPFMILGLLAGGYLGGAAANHRWNPADWDRNDPSTYLGVFGGAIAGALLPVGFSASVSAIGVGGTFLLGGGVAYVSSAAANQNWDPSKWQWDRPHTWNALFQGFAAGSGMAGGMSLAHNFAKYGKALTSISTATRLSRNAIKIGFLGISYSAGGGLAYGAGVLGNNGETAFWKWDWSNPATWSSLIDGFDVGMGWPQNFIEIGRGVTKSLSRASFNLGKQLKMSKLKSVLKNPKHPLYKMTGSVVMVYFMGSAANSEFDITRWSLASFSTYEGVLNGIFSGKDASNLLLLARRSKTKVKSNSLIPTYKNKIKHWAERFSNMIDNIQAIRKMSEYKLSMEQLFSSDKIRHDTLKLLLRDEPHLQEAERIFKGGLERWHKGEIHVPEKLKRLMLQEAEKKVYGSPQAQKLVQWEKEEVELLRKQREVFPDRDVEFLNCHSILSRRKRSDTKMSCIPSSPAGDEDTSMDKPKEEISEQFYYRTDPGIKRGILEDDGFRSIQPKSENNPLGFDSNKPRGFGEHFSLILRNTPTFLAPSKRGFFQNFILGSLYTTPTHLAQVTKDTYVKIETVDTFLPKGRNTHKTNILKTFHKQDDGTVMLKTFIFEEHGIKSNFDYENKLYKDNLVSKSKYSASELHDISTELGFIDNYNIKENIFYITSDNSLSIKELSTTRNDYQTEPSSSNQKFDQIKHVDIESEYLDNLSSNEVNQVELSMKAISKKIIEAYDSVNGGGKFGSEAEFHGFVYGALSFNFKYRYHLDIYVERIAGRGYADLLLLSRKDNNNNKNWKAIPIIIEFKADKTTTYNAEKQILDKGYLYNLSMRTTADQAIIVGMNPNIKDDPKSISIENIPQPKGLITEVIKNIKDKDKTEVNIKEEIKHLYYSISPSSIKKGKSYFSRLVLGEFLSTNDIDAHVHEATDGITSFVFKKKGSTDWIMLNIIDDIKKIQKSGNKFIKLPNNISIDRLTKIDVNIDPSKQNAKSVSDGFSHFLKKPDISNVDPSILKKFSKTEYIKLNDVDVDNFFIRGNLEGELDTLSKTESIREMVNSESDFQAILHGIFLNNANKNPLKTIKVLPEANFSKAGRLDLLVCQRHRMLPSSPPFMENVLIMELKYAKNNYEEKLKEANAQIFKYRNNKSITDSKTLTPITIIFNKAASSDENAIIHLVHSDDSISHTSSGQSSGERLDVVDAVSDLSVEDIHFEVQNLHLDDADLEPPRKKSKIDRRGRSVNYTKQFETISRKDALTDKLGDINNAASSGARSRLHFWPFEMIKSVSFMITSNMPIGWISNVYPKKDQSSNRLAFLEPDLSVNYQSPREHNKMTTPSLLEMGDQWYQQSDIHGLLNLGILLVRKWTGYKQKSNSYEVVDDVGRSIRLDIQSTATVDKFINVILQHARHYGIDSYMSDILQDTKLYYSTIKKVREKLARGEFDDITYLLHQQLVQNNIKKLISKSSQEQINNFLTAFAEYIPDLEQELFEYEQKSALKREHTLWENTKMTIPTQTTNNNIEWNTVEFLSETASSNQQYIQQCSAAFNKTEIFINASTSR